MGGGGKCLELGGKAGGFAGMGGMIRNVGRT